MSSVAESVKQIPVWDKEPGDVVRFVLRRDEWELLLRGLVVSASRANDTSAWDALEVLRHCVEDYDSSHLKRAMNTILSECQPSELIRCIANAALEKAEGK